MKITPHPELGHSREELWHKQHQAALLLLNHDVGLKVAHELIASNPRVIEMVIAQMANGAQPDGLDVDALGTTPKQRLEILDHLLERRTREEKLRSQDNALSGDAVCGQVKGPKIFGRTDGQGALLQGGFAESALASRGTGFGVKGA